MTAAGGIIHEEYHSPAFAKTGGPFRMVQLWVNLPAKDKMAPGGYQGITAADIPTVELPGGAGISRVIAGELLGAKGPARTFTPINVWDVRLNRDADLTLDLPEGHTAMLVMLGGHVTVNGGEGAGEAEMKPWPMANASGLTPSSTPVRGTTSIIERPSPGTPGPTARSNG